VPGSEPAQPAQFAGFPDAAFRFFEGLQADNSKTYWTAHKHLYDTAVRAPMQALVDEIAPAPAKLFRPYRDVRFSADKSPYKTHQGAFCEVAGGVGYYVQIDADGLFTGAGFWPHDKEYVARYRAAVDDPTTGPALQRIITKLTRAGFEIGGDRVKTRPRGCPPDHPRLELMRHDSLYLGRRAPATPELSTPAARDVVAGDWRALRPFVAWITGMSGR
jgi:uncharacterized protein (TIGR02453 family)